MGTGRPRSLTSAIVALVLIAVVAPAPPAPAKPKGKHHLFTFGTRNLGRGAKGKDVRYLQRALTRLGIATSIDGVFGKGTMRSVKALEEQHGWPVNGVISKKDAKRISKLLAKHRVSGSYFVAGYVPAALDLSARKAGTARVKVLDASGNLVHSVAVSFDGAGSKAVSWNGMLTSGVVPDGTYQLKLADRGTSGASVSGGQTEPFGMHLHAFPVPGPHNFGGPDARFGAPRSGHIHQGQDIPAACGQKEMVDETGQVRTVKVLSGPGAGLDQAAAKAVERIRFRPAMRKGKAVPAQITYRYTFLLD